MWVDESVFNLAGVGAGGLGGGDVGLVGGGESGAFSTGADVCVAGSVGDFGVVVWDLLESAVVWVTLFFLGVITCSCYDDGISGSRTRYCS